MFGNAFIKELLCKGCGLALAVAITVSGTPLCKKCLEHSDEHTHKRNSLFVSLRGSSDSTITSSAFSLTQEMLDVLIFIPKDRQGDNKQPSRNT